MQALLKDMQLRSDIKVCEITFIRTSLAMFGSIIVLLAFRHNPITEVRRELALPLFVRCLSGSLAFICVTKTLNYLPLTLFQVLHNTTPFVVAILAYFILNENLGIFQVVCMVCFFTGILLLILVSPEEEAASEDSLMTDYQKGIALAFTCVLLFASSRVLTRYARGVHFSIVQFYLALVGLVISSIWMAIESDGSGEMLRLGTTVLWIEIIAASYLHFTA